MPNRSVRPRRAAARLLPGITLLAAGAGAALAGSPAHPEAAMAAPLHHALVVARRTQASTVRDAGAAARTAAERLSRHFLVRDEDPEAPARGPLATFKAVLETGAPDEIATLADLGARIRGRTGRIVSFEAPLMRAEEFAALPALRFLDIARRLRPELDVSRAETGALEVHDPAGPYATRGEGVLVAVFDMGQNLKHADFRTPKSRKRTRFRSLYNMDPSCEGTPPPGHGYGCHYRTRRINKFLQGKVRLTYGDPAATFGHGSHVTGIAGGNGRASCRGCPRGVYVGMAPGAGLIGVKAFDAEGTYVGDVPEALQFLAEEQARLGNRPLVVNMSLGHQLGAHDGTDPDELAIDAFVQEGRQAGATRVVVKSAGNAGRDGIYMAGAVAPGAPEVHTFEVPADAACPPLPGEGNDLGLVDLWYEGDVEITIRLTAPDGATFLENSTGHDPSLSTLDTAFGTIFVECPEAAHPLNGDRECVLGVDDTGGIAPAGGAWTVSVGTDSLPSSSSGRYDAWLAIAEKGDCTWGWDRPSPGYSISLPGTAREVITVGAYVTKDHWRSVTGWTFTYAPAPTLGDLAPFSAEGPTRDGRPKPDLTAPGMGIVSSRAWTVSIASGTEGRYRTVPDRRHMILEGTSMAAPHVAGAAALLLSLDPTLDADEVRDLLIGTALQDGFSSNQPDRWGAGKMDVLEAAKSLVP